MPTPIRASYVKRSEVGPSGVEGPGGTWRDSIELIDKPGESRQWDFFVQAGFRGLPHIVSWPTAESAELDRSISS
jgi:hypothetical protein